jgi:hypothetical protein
LNYRCKKKRKFWNIMEVGFFCCASFCNIYIHLTMMLLHFSRKESRKNNNILCCLNFKHCITNFCNHYYCCKAFLLLLLLFWLLWKQTRKKICGKIVNHQNVILLSV